MKKETERAELNAAAILAAYLLSRISGRKLEPLEESDR